MGQYKEKSCKFCEKLHRKRGPYCSQSCANYDRPEYSQKVADNMRRVAIEHNKTPEAIAQQKLLHTGISIDDFAVGVPDIQDPPDLDGYDKAERW